MGNKRLYSPMSLEKKYHPIYGLNSPPKSTKSPRKSPRKSRRLVKRYKVQGKGTRKHKKFRSKKTKRSRNLGKQRSFKRIQYGCKSNKLKNMKGGGPIFQPFTDTARVFEANSKDTYNTYMGNDPNTNETIIRDPASVDSNYNFNNQ
tara:strand:+ start:7819 stop:8259 length:441 start_codon:yes stop_codon:yes gene_type:complete